MTAHGPARPALEESNGEADLVSRLERLRLRTRQLERERIFAGPTGNRADLVALDVELCRMEAAKRMLAPTPTPAFEARGALIPGAPWSEPFGSNPELGEARTLLDVLGDRSGTTRRSDQREDRRWPSPTPRLMR